MEQGDIYRCMLSLGIMFVEILQVSTLSGHVCTRHRAEEYVENYNRAFLCPERYTTACGHLDWRRCTKYRVNTCYTPGARNAVRYHTVEECCPGWRDAGAGSCTTPVCPDLCQNGGICADIGGMPGCKCGDGFYGDRCEKERNEVEGWKVAILCMAIVIVVVLFAFVVFVYKRSKFRTKIQPSPLSQQSSSLDETNTAPGNQNSRHSINNSRLPQTTANVWATAVQPTAPAVSD